MKTINVRELRQTIPHLSETLAREHELVLVSNGEPVARILPVESTPALESLAWLRAMAPVRQEGIEETIRADRDRRGT